MPELSISLTLGKASSGNADPAHNHREMIAKNIDPNRVCDNITYVRKDVREAYEELFSAAVAEYNLKQKQPCRRIEDYYERICEGKRVEPFYELIVQFGDSQTAGIGSQNGAKAQKMLDEYIRSFHVRNPNLHIFCGMLHNDEASPHLHIDFIPFYTQGHKNGLSKGVSMKSALIEQGFNPQSANKNQLVLWQDSERKVMEQILQKYGFKRDVKNDKHKHQSVTEHKESKDEKKLLAFAKSQQPDYSIENVTRLQNENNFLYTENKKLIEEKQSPWKSFFFSDKAKLDFVLTEVKLRNIPVRETENGFDVQEINVEEVRRIEKSYQSSATSHRATLIDDLDRITMQVNSFEDIIAKLQQYGYTIKKGKYIAVKPQNGEKFIRLKSLGEEYSEQSIRNRLAHKMKFESDINEATKTAKPDTLDYAVKNTIRQYTVVFAHNVLPVRKRNPKKPFCWTNSEELDRLSDLNKKINNGATLESLQREFTETKNNLADSENKIETLKSELTFFQDLYQAGQRCFKFMQEDQTALSLLAENKVTADNYERITELITADKNEINELEKSLPQFQKKLKEATDIFELAEKVSAGTWVQYLINQERPKQQAEFWVENGTRCADSETEIISPNQGRKK